MQKYLKSIVVLILIAGCAAGSLTSRAQAEFTFVAYEKFPTTHATYKSRQSASFGDVFRATAGKTNIRCKEASGEGTSVSGDETTLTIAVAYSSNCSAAGIENTVTVEPTSCHLKFHISAKDEVAEADAKYTGTADVLCTTPGDSIHVTVWTGTNHSGAPTCDLTIDEQEGINGITYTNITPEEGPNYVKVDINATNLHVTTTKGGLLCGENTGVSSTAGTFEGTDIVEGFKEGEQVSVGVTENEKEFTFVAYEKFPTTHATYKSRQSASFGDVFRATAGKTNIRCKEASGEGTSVSGDETTLTIAVAYSSNCSAAGIENTVTVEPTSCHLKFHISAKDEVAEADAKYTGTADVLCTTPGDSIHVTVWTGTNHSGAPTCDLTIDEQEGINGITYTNITPEEGPNYVKVDINATNLHVTTTKGGLLCGENTGVSSTAGTFEGTDIVEGFKEGEQVSVGVTENEKEFTFVAYEKFPTTHATYKSRQSASFGDVFRATAGKTNIRCKEASGEGTSVSGDETTLTIAVAYSSNCSAAGIENTVTVEPTSCHLKFHISAKDEVAEADAKYTGTADVLCTTPGDSIHVTVWTGTNHSGAPTCDLTIDEQEGINGITYTNITPEEGPNYVKVDINATNLHVTTTKGGLLCGENTGVSSTAGTFEGTDIVEGFKEGEQVSVGVTG